MDNSAKPISPEKVTTPIQLLGAWLAGLLSINGCFLFAAANMDEASWQSGALTIAAIVNVPLFIVAVFLLQTKFRPELQEDSYYSTYLNKKTNEVVKVSREESHLSAIQASVEKIEKGVSQTLETPRAGNGETAIDDITVGVNRRLENYDEVVQQLLRVGVLAVSDFGTMQHPGIHKVAVSPLLSKAQIRRITEIAKELGFDYFGFYNADEIDRIDEDVLFGAYGSGTQMLIADA